MIRFPRVFMVALLIPPASGCSDRSSGHDPTGLESPVAPTSSAHYTVHINAARPLQLEASLDLGEFAGTARTAGVQGAGFGLAPQVRDVRCDEVGIGTSAEGVWPLPDGCRQLQWTIAVRAAEALAVDASEQASLFFADPGWWVLSEPTSLLRVSNATPGQDLGLRVVGLAVDAQQAVGAVRPDGSWRVPPIGSAPEFYAFGALQTRALEMGALRVSYVFDDPVRVEAMPLASGHRRMLDHLLTALPLGDGDQSPHLLVVWLGIDSAHGQAGGAAGSRSFLANYIVGADDDAELNAVRTLMILGHEQVHQLIDAGHPSAPLPTWASESLAQFYGLSALRHSGLAEAAVERAWSRFIDPAREIDATLRALQAQHEAGDGDAYTSFYTQGATFWFDVDRVLRSNGVADGLDAQLPAVLAGGFDGSDLSPSLRAELVRQGGAEMEAVLARYL
jgi:hypothetical protein